MFRAQKRKWIVPIIVSVLLGWGVYRVYPIHFGLSGDWRAAPEPIFNPPGQKTPDKPLKLRVQFVINRLGLDQLTPQIPKSSQPTVLTADQFQLLLQTFRFDLHEFDAKKSEDGPQTICLTTRWGTYFWSYSRWYDWDPHSRMFVGKVQMTTDEGVLFVYQRRKVETKETLCFQMNFVGRESELILPDYPPGAQLPFPMLVDFFHTFNAACPADQDGIYAWRVPASWNSENLVIVKVVASQN